jgi:hypothetical protein
MGMLCDESASETAASTSTFSLELRSAFFFEFETWDQLTEHLLIASTKKKNIL